MSAELPHDLDSLEGFERLYRAYYGYTWAVLARLGVPPALVDDAHQDLFVTAYRRRDTFERGRPVKPWLVGIARRVAFRYRRSQRRTDRKQTALSHASGRERLAVRDLHAQIEAGQFLQAFIEELDPRQREVFVLGELEGYTGPEIAQRLGINLDTAYTRLRSARAQLRRALGAVEERRIAGARIDRGLVLLLPRLSTPGRLAWLWGLGAKAKLGVAMGVAAAGLAAVVVVGAAAPPKASESAEVGGTPVVVTEGARVAPGAAPAHVDRPTEASVPAAPAPPMAAMLGPPTEMSSPGPRAARLAPPLADARSGLDPREAADSGSPGADAAADLQHEVDQLTAAREALAAGHPAEALAILEKHARAHPSSTLAEGRAALRIASLCAAGQREQARGEAAVLLRSHPGSTLARHATTRCDEPNP